MRKYSSFSVKIFLKVIVFSSIIFFSNSIYAQPDYLISDGGTVYVSSGDKFYDAGGPAGNVSSAPINDNFNSSIISTGWASTSLATYTNNACTHLMIEKLKRIQNIIYKTNLYANFK